MEIAGKSAADRDKPDSRGVFYNYTEGSGVTLENIKPGNDRLYYEAVEKAVNRLRKTTCHSFSFEPLGFIKYANVPFEAERKVVIKDIGSPEEAKQLIEMIKEEVEKASAELKMGLPAIKEVKDIYNIQSVIAALVKISSLIKPMTKELDAQNPAWRGGNLHASVKDASSKTAIDIQFYNGRIGEIRYELCETDPISPILLDNSYILYFRQAPERTLFIASSAWRYDRTIRDSGLIIPDANRIDGTVKDFYFGKNLAEQIDDVNDAPYEQRRYGLRGPPREEMLKPLGINKDFDRYYQVSLPREILENLSIDPGSLPEIQVPAGVNITAISSEKEGRGRWPFKLR